MDDDLDSSLPAPNGTNNAYTNTNTTTVPEDEAIDLTDNKAQTPTPTPMPSAATSREAEHVTQHESLTTTDGVVRTLDGEIAGDEFAADALNYQILLRKIDDLLERLRLDA